LATLRSIEAARVAAKIDHCGVLSLRSAKALVPTPLCQRARATALSRPAIFLLLADFISFNLILWGSQGHGD
jgi:hypothetical protein